MKKRPDQIRIHMCSSVDAAIENCDVVKRTLKRSPRRRTAPTESVGGWCEATAGLMAPVVSSFATGTEPGYMRVPRWRKAVSFSDTAFARRAGI